MACGRCVKITLSEIYTGLRLYYDIIIYNSGEEYVTKNLLILNRRTVYYYYYYWYSALGPVWAETRAQSGEYGSGTLHPGQVLGGSLPLLSPAF